MGKVLQQIEREGVMWHRSAHNEEHATGHFGGAPGAALTHHRRTIRPCLYKW